MPLQGLPIGARGGGVGHKVTRLQQMTQKYVIYILNTDEDMEAMEALGHRLPNKPSVSE